MKIIALKGTYFLNSHKANLISVYECILKPQIFT